MPITLTGIVHHGLNQGKNLGAPTANLDISLAESQKLTRGLYVCETTLDTKKYNGLLYYGYNSLSKIDCLEVHLMDFSGDLYGQEITVAVKNFLRGEIRFKDKEELKKQIEEDVKNFTAILKNHSPS